MSERDCSERLAIAQRRISRWRAQVQAQKHALVRVEVKGEDREAGGECPIAFVAPNGYRIEGLTIDQAIALLRALT